MTGTVLNQPMAVRLCGKTAGGVVAIVLYSLAACAWMGEAQA